MAQLVVGENDNADAQQSSEIASRDFKVLVRVIRSVAAKWSVCTAHRWRVLWLAIQGQIVSLWGRDAAALYFILMMTFRLIFFAVELHIFYQLNLLITDIYRFRGWLLKNKTSRLLC